MKTYDESKKITFGAYSKTCIRNRLVSCLRRASSKKRQKIKDNDEGVSESLQDTVVKRELEEKLISLAEKVLSNYELRIFKMYAHGARAKEISAKIGKDEKSVNNAIFRIRSKLKKQSNIDITVEVSQKFGKDKIAICFSDYKKITENRKRLSGILFRRAF